MLSSKSEITSLSLVILSIVTSLNASLPAEPHNPNTDWFMKAGYGVFVHYLWDIQNSSQELHSLGKETSWDECVQEFDAEKFADLMDQVGAGYVIFTMHQRTRFLIAPNATFDRLTGYKPGHGCARPTNERQNLMHTALLALLMRQLLSRVRWILIGRLNRLRQPGRLLRAYRLVSRFTRCSAQPDTRHMTLKSRSLTAMRVR